MAVVAVVLFGAIIARVDGVARGAPVAVGDALSIGVNRMLSMIGSAFVAGIAIVVGCILLVIPGLIVMVFLLFGPYAVIIERMGPLESLGYSRALVRGHWWRTAALLTIIGIILTVFYIVLLTVAGFAVFSNPETLATGQMPWYIQFVVGPVLSAVGAPLAYSLLLSIYYDLKLRHEGGDLAARIAATA